MKYTDEGKQGGNIQQDAVDFRKQRDGAMTAIEQTGLQFWLVDTANTFDRGWETMVFPCSVNGKVPNKAWGKPLLERRYANAAEAKSAHNAICKELSALPSMETAITWFEKQRPTLRLTYYLHNQSKLFSPPQIFETTDEKEFQKAVSTAKREGYEIISTEQIDPPLLVVRPPELENPRFEVVMTSDAFDDQAEPERPSVLAALRSNQEAIAAKQTVAENAKVAGKSKNEPTI